MYRSINKAPKIWPVARKGRAYLAVPTHEKNTGVPLSIVTRDMLGLVKSKKELQKLINEKKIEINDKVVIETNYPVLLGDNLSFPSAKKYYKMTITGKRMGINEVDAKKAGVRIYKVVSKKLLRKNTLQVNLNNGKNILTKDKINTGDFVVLNNKDNKITEVIVLKKGAEVLVIKGKHIGVRGKIKDIHEEGHQKIAEIETEGETIKVNVDNLYAE